MEPGALAELLERPVELLTTPPNPATKLGDGWREGALTNHQRVYGAPMSISPETMSPASIGGPSFRREELDGGNMRTRGHLEIARSLGLLTVLVVLSGCAIRSSPLIATSPRVGVSSPSANGTPPSPAPQLSKRWEFTGRAQGGYTFSGVIAAGIPRALP